MHSANIALAIVALPLTTNLVILFSSLCHQKYCLFNLCLSFQVFLFSFLGFLFLPFSSTLWMNVAYRINLTLICLLGFVCLALFGLYRDGRVTWMWNCKVKSTESREDYGPPVESFFWLITQNQQRCTVDRSGHEYRCCPVFKQDKPFKKSKAKATPAAVS